MTKMAATPLGVKLCHSKSTMLRGNFAALSFVEQELLSIELEVLHCALLLR